MIAERERAFWRLFLFNHAERAHTSNLTTEKTKCFGQVSLFWGRLYIPFICYDGWKFLVSFYHSKLTTVLKACENNHA